MFGESCCTLIPNNTAPDGSVTKALNDLKALKDWLKTAVDISIKGWFDTMFGKWKTGHCSQWFKKVLRSPRAAPKLSVGTRRMFAKVYKGEAVVSTLASHTDCLLDLCQMLLLCKE